MEARPFESPSLDGWVIYRSRTVENEMNVQRLGHRLIDTIEGFAELDRPMTAGGWHGTLITDPGGQGFF